MKNNINLKQMNIQFITADEARTKTNENLNSFENPFFEKDI